MSSDSEGDGERRMGFTTENDFEGGEWRGGEFFYKSQRKGRTMNRDEQIYGVFDESDSGEEHSAGFNKRKRTRKDKEQVGAAVSRKPVSFVSGGGSGGIDESKLQNTTNLSDDVDDSAETFHKIIGSIASNADFRAMVHTAAHAANKPKPPPVVSKDLGQWEKHTKGFGKKMLEKMGFTGRLGAKETGISASLQVKVRPNQMGLGFGDFVESTTLEANKKLEAELHGREYIPPPPGSEGKGGKGQGLSNQGTSRGIVEDRAASKSWKLGGLKLSEKQLMGAGAGVEDHMDQAPRVSGKKGTRKKGVQFADILSTTGSDAAGGGYEQSAFSTKQIILDMRGPQPMYVTDTATLSKERDADTQPLLGQELLYNVNLVVDMAQMDLMSDERRLHTVSSRISTLEEDRKLMSEQLEVDSARLESLELIEKALNRMSTAMKTYEDCLSKKRGGIKSKPFQDDTTDVSIRRITREDVIQGFVKLTSRCPEEAVLLGLIDIIPSFSEPILMHELSLWDPVDNPMGVVEVYVDWMSALSVFEVGDTLRDADHTSTEPSSQAASVQVAYKSLQSIMERLLLPKLRRYLTNDFDVKDPQEVETCALMLKGLKGMVSNDTFRSMVDMLLLPRLKSAVASWNPIVDTTPIDQWVVPWVHVLGAAVSVVFPDIRRKIAKALDKWEPSDLSAYYIIKPWIGVFDTSSMSQLLIRNIVPKLVTALRNQSVEPRGQSTAHLAAVILWKDVLPREHLFALIEGEFFPKWFHVLAYWLGSEDVNLGEVSEWYTSWKSQFPDDITEDPMVTSYFSKALDLMSMAVMHNMGEGGDKKSGRPEFRVPMSLLGGVNYFQIMEKKKAAEATEKRLEELRRGDLPHRYTSGSGNSEYQSKPNSSRQDRPAPSAAVASSHRAKGRHEVTFREVVEEFAARNGVTFTPKLTGGGQVQVSDGKQLWSFADKVTCYIEQNVVFARASRQSGGRNASSWTPVALETLLDMAQTSQ